MPELYPDDQRKVDRFLESNVNQIERRPFRPFKLLLILGAVLIALSAIAFIIASTHGVV